MASSETLWGWDNGRGITWVGGTLEESFARVSRNGGRWLLRSAVPLSEYHRVMAETESAGTTRR